MTGLIVNNFGHATAILARVNARLGYPKAGVDIGGGLHATALQSMTTSHASVRAHPTLSLWAIQGGPELLAIIVQLRADVPAATIPSPAALTPDWDVAVS